MPVAPRRLVRIRPLKAVRRQPFTGSLYSTKILPRLIWKHNRSRLPSQFSTKGRWDFLVRSGDFITADGAGIKGKLRILTTKR
ncbi:hypothetical protein HPP92_015898 [Vanilla planifolia]|uniref:Uncharacterized protein n=1 Tax=Vanilla planifolia TaxID=51239 RepID=A0A835URJ4_VANPL|nr:hypothetical protein HPP92_016521 [Vanilla planifolia]KAG0471352.1 hypothetical protein HPP92_015898 [Vanilla planifolia]